MPENLPPDLGVGPQLQRAVHSTWHRSALSFSSFPFNVRDYFVVHISLCLFFCDATTNKTSTTAKWLIGHPSHKVYPLRLRLSAVHSVTSSNANDHHATSTNLNLGEKLALMSIISKSSNNFDINAFLISSPYALRVQQLTELTSGFKIVNRRLWGLTTRWHARSTAWHRISASLSTPFHFERFPLSQTETVRSPSFIGLLSSCLLSCRSGGGW